MTFVKHTSCDNCGSRDNMALYTDGHGWCFGCGYFHAPPVTERIRQTFAFPHERPNYGRDVYDDGRDLVRSRSVVEGLLSTSDGESQGVVPPIPDDTAKYIPGPVLTWLRKYGILEAEIKDNCFGWSEEQQRLIMPVYSGSSWVDKSSRGSLLMWQGRYFGPNEKKSKYYTGGPADTVMHLINDRASDTIVFTEDLISAIKVGRQFTTMPLWGSSMSLARMVRISKITQSALIWLDDDKYQEALRARNRLAQYIPNVYVCRTPRDPKEYNDDAIFMYVTNSALGGK